MCLKRETTWLLFFLSYLNIHTVITKLTFIWLKCTCFLRNTPFKRGQRQKWRPKLEVRINQFHCIIQCNQWNNLVAKPTSSIQTISKNGLHENKHYVYMYSTCLFIRKFSKAVITRFMTRICLHSSECMSKLFLFLRCRRHSKAFHKNDKCLSCCDAGSPDNFSFSTKAEELKHKLVILAELLACIRNTAAHPIPTWKIDE